jgi:peptidoglycan hydrolase-like protein with peptidoglycan-binding domain
VQTAPTPQRISEIQSALAAQGVYQRQPNGKWDAETAQAMRDFQSTHGLTATGKLDALTLQKLGLGSEIAGRAAPWPSHTPEPTDSTPQQTP